MATTPPKILLLTDEALAERSIADPNAYATLVLRHREPLVNFVQNRITNDRASAEDVAQESLLKAYENLRGFNTSKKFKTWLYKIAINTAYTSLRRPQPEPLDRYAEVLESGDSPETYADAKVQEAQLEAALSALEPNHRAVLSLYYIRQMTYAEIAAELSVHQSTVKSRIARARQHLAVNLKG